MARTRYFPALVALAALLVLTVGPARAATTGNESTMAREIADDINHERAARGLAAIPLDGQYAAGAQRVAESNRDRPCHACHSTEHPSGEIVWWGSNHPSSGSTIWWMGSPPHRALVLAPTATKLGVGVACNGTEHDAVAWIETPASASNPPATPVATKEGTGSRCQGGATTPVTKPAAAATPAATTTTAAGGRRGTATTTAPSNQNGPSTTATAKPRRGSATTRRGADVRRSALPGNSGGGGGGRSRNTVAPRRYAMGSDVEQRFAFRAAAGTRPAPAAGGMGGTGTALLLSTFVAVLLLGRMTHRRRAS